MDEKIQTEFDELTKNYEKHIEKLEDEIDKQDEYAPYPDTQKGDSFFKFFREILNSKDSKKTANLSYKELGQLNHTVRRYLEVGQIADTQNMNDVRRYYNEKAEIIAATSMAKKGFFLKTAITKLKGTVTEKENTEQKGFPLFGKKKGGTDVE